MVDTYIVDMNGTQANAADTTVPADRNFRGAWVLDGTVISENIDAAKEIFKDKIREVRRPLLEAKDVELMKALETGADTTAIVAEKTRLRDITNQVDTMTTVDELKTASIT